ncbi:peptide chain release factor 2 [Bacillus sp. AFS018417]|nr:peptide chain release factor 2 [Bacillus sp. AFS018417]PHA01277.1 peptide chain release factor 2 [Bacillus pseudomycoides]
MINEESNSNYIEVTKMELVEIRQELEKMAKRLAAFRGSL